MTTNCVSDDLFEYSPPSTCMTEIELLTYYYVGLVLSNQIWVMALSVCFIFTITIGTFPAVTVEVQSTVADGGAWGESPFLTSVQTATLLQQLVSL